MLIDTRKVITGIKDNTSKILSDEVVEAITPYEEFPSFQLQNLFYTEENPQSLDIKHNNSPYEIDIPVGAMRFLKLRMPTKQEMTANLLAAGQEVPQDWTRFNLHNTDTVDYIYVLSGEITCVVGEELLELKTGDFLAQVGPEHTWINDHDEPCYLLCVMVGIKSSGARLKMSVE